MGRAMKSLLCFLIISGQANATHFICKIRELPADEPGEIHLIDLGGERGKVVDSVFVKSKAYRLQGELYFSDAVSVNCQATP